MSVYATYHGNITDTGGEDCDFRGFVWDTTSRGDPGDVAPGASAYASNWTEGDSYGTGAFNHQETGLAEGDTFYVRACAHNSGGWSYGGEVSFNTPTAYNRSASVIVGIVSSASKTYGVVKTASVIIGALASATRATAIARASSVIVGIVSTASRTLSIIRRASTLIGIAPSASKTYSMVRTAIVYIGVSASASRGFGKVITSSVIVGVVASASRRIAIIRQAATVIGNAVSASRLVAYTRKASKEYLRWD